MMMKSNERKEAENWIEWKMCSSSRTRYSKMERTCAFNGIHGPMPKSHTRAHIHYERGTALCLVSFCVKSSFRLCLFPFCSCPFSQFIIFDCSFFVCLTSLNQTVCWLTRSRELNIDFNIQPKQKSFSFAFNFIRSLSLATELSLGEKIKYIFTWWSIILPTVYFFHRFNNDTMTKTTREQHSNDIKKRQFKMAKSLTAQWF